MHAPLFALCKDKPELQAYLGINPFRLYPFGNAPRDGLKPYAVWQRIGGAAEIALNGDFGFETIDLQLDCYADNLIQVRSMIKTFYEVLYNQAQIVRYGLEAFEPEAQLWRSSFDMRFMRTH